MENAVVEHPEEWPHFAKLKEIDQSTPVYPRQTYLLDGLLPTGKVHVLVGSSGVGRVHSSMTSSTAGNTKQQSSDAKQLDIRT